VNASPGAAVGQIYFDADTVEKMHNVEKQDVIMVRPFTKPDDVHGMLSAKGILTSEGGATSHAAVVARQFGVPCIVGASEISIDMVKRQMTRNGVTVKEGEWISLDGTTGEVFVGKLGMTTPDLSEQKELMTLLGWADEVSRLQVWANADYPRTPSVHVNMVPRVLVFAEPSTCSLMWNVCQMSRRMIMNAENTQRMLNNLERLEAALASGRFEGRVLTDEDKRALKAEIDAEKANMEKSAEVQAYFGALKTILPLQRGDFYGLFEAMTGLPVIIRLIDPLLHEFLPSLEDLLTEVATLKAKGISEGLAEKEHMLDVVQGMHESNPMMGLRGIRLGIVYTRYYEDAGESNL
jgi:pyruvate,orthophosphate dikinase